MAVATPCIFLSCSNFVIAASSHVILKFFTELSAHGLSIISVRNCLPVLVISLPPSNMMLSIFAAFIGSAIHNTL